MEGVKILTEEVVNINIYPLLTSLLITGGVICLIIGIIMLTNMSLWRNAFIFLQSGVLVIMASVLFMAGLFSV